MSEEIEVTEEHAYEQRITTAKTDCETGWIADSIKECTVEFLKKWAVETDFSRSHNTFLEVFGDAVTIPYDDSDNANAYASGYMQTVHEYVSAAALGKEIAQK